jgi:integrase
MILGIVGACRREDLYTMRIEDFEEREGLVIVKVPQKKRSFIVINEPDEKAHYLDIYYKYRNLRPSHAKSSHFFLNYRNEKCTNQVIGKGTIGSWPSKIAEYLKLKNPAGYTGNSFRRSALLANKIEDPGLKRHGGCKSSITAEKDCVENNIQFQEDKENSEYEYFDNANVAANPLVYHICFQDSKLCCYR